VIGKNLVELDISEHCIETAARKEHQKLTCAVLEGTDLGAALEARIALLDRFLRETDLRRLRAEDPRLAGGSDVRMKLRLSADGRVDWRIL